MPDFLVTSWRLPRNICYGEVTGKLVPVEFELKGVTNWVALHLHVCVSDVLQAAIERGEKLGELEERTAQMRTEAEEYAKAAHQLKNKYRDKKWYQLWIRTPRRRSVQSLYVADMPRYQRSHLRLPSTERLSVPLPAFLCIVSIDRLKYEMVSVTQAEWY